MEEEEEDVYHKDPFNISEAIHKNGGERVWTLDDREGDLLCLACQSIVPCNDFCFNHHLDSSQHQDNFSLLIKSEAEESLGEDFDEKPFEFVKESNVKEFDEEPFESENDEKLIEFDNKIDEKTFESRKDPDEESIKSEKESLKGIEDESKEVQGGSSEAIRLEFERDIAKLFAVCNIPLSKGQDPCFRKFIQTHTGYSVPPQEKLISSIKDNSSCVLDEVRDVTRNKDLVIRMSEAKDFDGKSYCAVLISPLDGSFNDPPYLVNVGELKGLTGSTVEAFLISTLKEVYESSFELKRLKLLITDGASHSLEVAKGLKSKNPSMIHLTCLSHGLHRITEQARFEFKDVHTLILETKKILGPISRKKKLMEACFLTMPSSNHTWLEQAYFHYVNFGVLKDFITSLEDDSVSLRKVKKIYKGDSILSDLMLIYVSLSGVMNAIHALEQRHPLRESIKIIEGLVENIQLEPFKSLLNSALKKNRGFKKMKEISSKLETDSKEWVKFTYAPIINCEARRIFKSLRQTQTSSRSFLQEKSIKNVLMVTWNEARMDQ